MTIGIYCIEHINSAKKYIGKSKNIEKRLQVHKYLLCDPKRSKDCNRHLHNAVQKYGIGLFKFYVLEAFENINELIMKERELYWIDFYNTCIRDFGYNLRRDSSTKMMVHEETLALQSIVHLGKNNANFGNRWSNEQKLKMSKIASARHAAGIVSTEISKRLQSESAKRTWSNKEKLAKMSLSVSISKRIYNFYQYTLEGMLVAIWDSVESIIEKNPEYKWQNIYAVCNGYKPSYRGFIWKKKLKNTS